MTLKQFFKRQYPKVLALQVDKVEVDTGLELHLSSGKRRGICPYCAHASRRLHSRSDFQKDAYRIIFLTWLSDESSLVHSVGDQFRQVIAETGEHHRCCGVSLNLCERFSTVTYPSSARPTCVSYKCI